MRMFSNLKRPLFLSGLMMVAVVMLGFSGTSAMAAASPAEDFVSGNVNKGLQILSNDSLTKDQKLTQFRSFLQGLTDLKRIALFTLGPAKNTASPADLAAFEDAFKDFAFAAYEAEFAHYSGQTLQVTGSVPHGPDDVLVTTKLIDPHAKPGDKPIQVDFRVFGSPGHFSIGDIIVLGIDLAINEQDQFTTFLAEHNNDMKALTADLKARAAKERAGGEVGGGSQ
jgi:phospholipid transport system substrate-binding protein